MNLDESGGICERKTLLRMKKEADQAGFKGMRMGPKLIFRVYFLEIRTMTFTSSLCSHLGITMVSEEQVN